LPANAAAFLLAAQVSFAQYKRSYLDRDPADPRREGAIWKPQFLDCAVVSLSRRRADDTGKCESSTSMSARPSQIAGAPGCDGGITREMTGALPCRRLAQKQCIQVSDFPSGNRIHQKGLGRSPAKDNVLDLGGDDDE